MTHMHRITIAIAALTLLGCPSDPKKPSEDREDMTSTTPEDMGGETDAGDMREDASMREDMRPDEDASMREDMPGDITPSGRSLGRIETPWSPSDNMVEDADFVLSTESWIAFDGANAIQRVRRAFTTSAPEDRPTIGLLPMSAQPSCIIGRVKWTRASSHDASIWIKGSDVAVLALAVDLERSTPALLAYDFTETDEVHIEEGQMWKRFRGVIPPSFGWGYLQICHTSEETVWLGAPTVVASQPAPGALRVLPEPLRPANERELERHEILTRHYSEGARREE